MGRNLKTVALGAALLGLGMSMPSCPGEKAMQQQLDSLQTSHADLTKKVQVLDAQIKTLNNEMTQVKQLLGQMTSAIQTQGGALERLDGAVKEIQTRLTPAARGGRTGAKAPAAPAHRRVH